MASHRGSSDLQALQDELDRAWLRRGVRGQQRRQLTDDVMADLHIADAAGDDPRSLIGPDTEAFADSVLAAREVEVLHRRLPDLLAAATAGGFAVVVAGLGPAFAAVGWAVETLPTQWELPAAVGVYTVLLCGAIVGALVGVALVLGRGEVTRATLRWTAPLLILSAVVVAPLSVATSRATNYSPSGLALAFMAVLIVGGFLIPVVVGRLLAVRAALR